MGRHWEKNVAVPLGETRHGANTRENLSTETRGMHRNGLPGEVMGHRPWGVREPWGCEEHGL